MTDLLHAFTEPGTWVALASLIALLVVLDVDNIVFMAVLAGHLPERKQKQVVQIGLGMALVMRALLLLGLGVLVRAESALFTITVGGFHFDGTPQALLTLGGGLFLLYKAVSEIHDKLEGSDPEAKPKRAAFGALLGQLAILNLIFSVDSVLTAVSMTNTPGLRYVGLLLSMGLVFVFALPIARAVQRHPTLKMLGLAFLLLLGTLLVTEALHVEVPKGYVYFAMAFALGVEILNINFRKKGPPVRLHGPAFQPDRPAEPTERRGVSPRLGDDPH